MITSDPKERILAAAERIFIEQGLEAVSLRAVTAEAQVNLAAVNYYYGSKAALLQALTQRFFLSVNREQLRHLEELEAKTLAPSIEELLVAYATPIFAVFDSPRGREWVQAWLMARNAKVPGPSHLMQGEEGTEVASRYYEALRKALPHLPADELRWRFERANGSLMAHQGKRAVQAAQDTERGKVLQKERKWLITYLVGALQAAATVE